MRLQCPDCTIIDHLSILVRKDYEAKGYRRPYGRELLSRTGSYSHDRIPEMGHDDSLDHASQPECHPSGFIVHISTEEIQSGSEREERQ